MALQRIDGQNVPDDTPADGKLDTRPEGKFNLRLLGCDIAAHIGILKREFDAVHPYDTRVLGSDGAVREIAKSFESEVQGFGLGEGMGEAELKRFGFFPGIRTSGTVFLLDKGSDWPHLAVIGHELAHEFANKNAAIYAKLVDTIQPYVDIGKYKAEFVNSTVGKNSNTPAKGSPVSDDGRGLKHGLAP